MRYSAQIRAARALLGLRQDELAKAAKIGPRHASADRAGRRRRPGQLLDGAQDSRRAREGRHRVHR